MTEIGRMIRDEGLQEGIKKGKQEGIKEGISKGIKEGKSDTLIKQLTKKFAKVPEDYKIKLKQLPEETIDIITLEIFDIKDIKEIEKYF